MREATFTVSPNRQYLGIAIPTTPTLYAKRATATVHWNNDDVQFSGMYEQTVKKFDNMPHRMSRRY